MKTTTRLAVLMALGLSAAACGSDGRSGPSIGLTGTYRVNGVSNNGRFSATAQIVESGGDISGNYSNSNGGTFRVRGSASGIHISGQLVGNARTTSQVVGGPRDGALAARVNPRAR